MALHGAPALVLVVLLLGLPTHGANALTAPVCQTSGASGLTTDCAKVISYLQNLGSTGCGNDNPLGSKCTTMHKVGTCTASICGSIASQPCNVVSKYVNTLTNNCASSINGQSRSGGYQYMNENSGLKVEIF